MRVSLVSALLVGFGVLALGADAQAQKTGAQQPKGQHVPHYVVREKANENLLMVLGGTLGGPYIQMAQDIAIAVSDGDNLRVLPIAGDGAMKNVRDVLLLRGVDLAITTDQVLNTLKASGEHGPNLERRIAYISPLAVDMLHVLVRPEIKSLKDLHGKKMNVMPKGSASSALVPKTLKALGIVVDEVNLTIADALQQMRSGNIDATACYCPAPVPGFASLGADLGFRFMEVPYANALEEAAFLPASLPSEVYPNLTAKGSNVPTVATMTVLITFNWAPGSDRYRKLEKFVNAFFSNFDKLRQPPRHPAWRSVNMAAGIRGWHRFPAAQHWLDRRAAQLAAEAAAAKAKARVAPAGIDTNQARKQAERAAPGDVAEQERLVNEFLEWSKKRKR
jgi:TRAP transporter TAXI family solute receptor